MQHFEPTLLHHQRRQTIPEERRQHREGRPSADPEAATEGAPSGRESVTDPQSARGGTGRTIRAEGRQLQQIPTDSRREARRHTIRARGYPERQHRGREAADLPTAGRAIYTRNIDPNRRAFSVQAHRRHRVGQTRTARHLPRPRGGRTQATQTLTIDSTHRTGGRPSQTRERGEEIRRGG